MPQTAEHSISVLEANRIVLMILEASDRARKEHSRAYNLVAEPRIEAWSETADVLGFGRDIAELAETSVATTMPADATGAELAKQPTRLAQALLQQLCDLVNLFFRVANQRMHLLASLPQGERDFAALQERYFDARPCVIKPLVEFGRLNAAILVAERYRDFKTLVELVFTHTTDAKERIPGYMSAFGEPFAFELFSHYIRTDDRRTLLEMEDRYSELLQRFLGQGGHDDIAWIHDLRLRLFGDASAKILLSASQNDDISWQKTMLSIGKLAYMATLRPFQLSDDAAQIEIAKFDEQLDTVAMQEHLVSQCRQLLEEGGEIASSVAEQVAFLMQKLATRIADKPAFSKNMRDWLGKLLQGIPLPADDLAEYITLKDYTDDELDDYGRALVILVMNADQLPEARFNAALRTVWRRVILHDNWAKIEAKMSKSSDEQMAERLRQTALHHVFVIADGEGIFDNDRAMLLRPREVYFSVAQEELALRFSGANQEQVDALWLDYSAENEQLENVFNTCHFDAFYQEVARLAEVEDAVAAAEAADSSPTELQRDMFMPVLETTGADIVEVDTAESAHADEYDNEDPSMRVDEESVMFIGTATDATSAASEVEVIQLDDTTDEDIAAGMSDVEETMSVGSSA
ncbi:Non-repetitive/WGA-negative nucleoporin C-terminal-domain-containing protein [Thamnocephalis sphaerospora]|uniref:Non-repetitive/WGA-negative nucleoporin C-terminal-domain-containing protein n=1 Tax=Thamnocephalis sphaerospora TaxID=78915 RepID=A0A4P9XS33_9FUNG|nr:Non-repetitive/WGA-negative nucleoporin C-terminal-domain-containing protein [Thamnocephalis sphaerospora]|eukprot:RKP08916.1 Non-repetitive/WGA-negative nucleoporin C-terminal-domain-containing protein [Thamnocephalis sphaerospora]